MNITYKKQIEKHSTDANGSESVVISVETYEFESKSDGHLKCLECDTSVWCIHMADMVSQDGDAEQFFSDSVVQSPEFSIQCPVFPTLNLFAKVNLVERPEFKAREVYFDDEDRANLDLQFVGFLHASEGRAVIRSLIFDWFTGTYAQKKFTCTSASHKPAQEAALQEMMKRDNSFLMARYAMWKTGSCPPCIQSSIQDFSDLIPGVEKPPSPWNKP